MKKITYLCDIDQDVDDIIAVEYLHSLGYLKDVVLDPFPVTVEGLSRVETLKQLGVIILDKINEDSNYIFVGGAFTKLAQYLKENKVDLIVANGGFVGCNIVDKKNVLDKFKNKTHVRTYNFNLDVNSTELVLNSKNVNKIILVGKNVCHSIKNTTSSLWKEEKFLDKFALSTQKRLHDLLMCYEGIKFINDNKKASLLEYKSISPNNLGLIGNMTKWGSFEDNKSNIIAAVSFK